MSVQSFLSGITWSAGTGRAARDLGLEKARLAVTDPRGIGLVGTSGYKQLQSPFVFAHLLQEASRPGGVLSNLFANRQFTGQVRGILARERQRTSEGARGLSQAGYNPGTAAAMYNEDPLRAQRDISGVRSGLESELQQNRFGAQQAFANQLASIEQTLFGQNLARKQLRDQDSASRLGMLFSGLGLATQAGIGVGALSALSGSPGTQGAQGVLQGLMGGGYGSRIPFDQKFT